METDAPATIPLDSAAYTLKVAGLMTMRLVRPPVLSMCPQSVSRYVNMQDKTWRLALHLIQLPEVQLAPSSPSSSTIAAALQVGAIRSSARLSNSPMACEQVKILRGGETPPILIHTFRNIRAVLGIQPGDHAEYEPVVSFPDGFWGSKLVSNVPIGDVYVECVIHCGNRVIGSSSTTTSRGATTEAKTPAASLQSHAMILRSTSTPMLRPRAASEGASGLQDTLGAYQTRGRSRQHHRVECLPLFDFKGRLITGTRELCLWPLDCTIQICQSAVSGCTQT